MANRLQKMLFNLSTLSPIAFFIVVVWWIQCGLTEVVLETEKIHLTGKAVTISVVGLIAIIFAFYSVFLVKTSCRNFEIVPVSATAVKSKESLAVCAIVSYILPFSSLVLNEYNGWLTVVIVGIALIFLFLSNTVWPSPILLLFGYHFYEIANMNGGAEFPMISERTAIKDAKTIKKVITLWDYCMIEVR